MNTPPCVLQRGDFVIVTVEGHSVDAMVVMASPNGRSLIVMFDAVLGA